MNCGIVWCSAPRARRSARLSPWKSQSFRFVRLIVQLCRHFHMRHADEIDVKPIGLERPQT